MSSSLPGRVFFCCCLPGESRGMHLRSQADGQEGSRGCCLHCPFASRCGKTPFPGKSGPAPHLARFQAAWLGGGTSLEGDPGRGGSAPSTQTQQLRGVGNDAGSSGCPRGLWTCRGAAQHPPRGQMSRGDTRSTTKLQHDWEGGGGREIPVAPALRAEGRERGGSRCQTPPPSSQRSPRRPPSPNDISSFPQMGASGPWGACPNPEEPP